MRTDRVYGASPIDIGLVDLDPCEWMAWLYCPIKLAMSFEESVPANLEQYRPLIDKVYDDVGADRWHENYVYITAKTLFVNADNPGNRPGWHSDGFMTDDLNYIWADANPTVFWERDEKISFTADHNVSLHEMAHCEVDTENHKTYPLKNLLRLDQTVMHKVADNAVAGMRTFVKISVSRHKYALKGNSINHVIAPDWQYGERSIDRNAPEKAAE